MLVISLWFGIWVPRFRNTFDRPKNVPEVSKDREMTEETMLFADQFKGLFGEEI